MGGESSLPLEGTSLSCSSLARGGLEQAGGGVLVSPLGQRSPAWLRAAPAKARTQATAPSTRSDCCSGVQGARVPNTIPGTSLVQGDKWAPHMEA